MEPHASLLPAAAVAAPALTAAIIAVLRRHPSIRDATLLIGAVVTFVIMLAMLPSVLAGEVPTTSLGQLIPGVELSLAADGMGMIFALLASLLWVLAGSYALGYMRGDNASHQTRFYAFYALCLSTAFGVAFAGDLLTFFIAYEALTVATYPLVTHKGDAKAIAAGRTYLGYLLTGGASVLLAVIIVYASTGELSFAAGGFVAGQMSTTLTIVVFLLFCVGFGTKAGLMPLHAWLPGAMVAPTPVSALLHAVAVVKGGVFAFGRMIGFVMGPEVLGAIGIQQVLSAVAGATILVASVMALRQDHLKRRLAYSTIAHLAYIVLGFSLLSASAYEGSLLHIVNHGALKITLFFAAGAIHIAAHKDYVSELDGIGRRMPFTMVAFAVASYGLAGLPPMGGFLSKWHLVLGALEAEQYLFAGIMVFSGLFTAGYLFPIVYRAFFKAPPDTEGGAAPEPGALGTAPPIGPSTGDDTPVAVAVATSDPRISLARLEAGPAEPHEPHGHDAHAHGEAPALMVVPLCLTAALGLVLGLGDLTGIYELARGVAAAVTGGGA